ncbi:MAG: hypothetical protein O4803_10240 [Trichodesmium sp. St15_bin1_1]|nr:hypothetical protein [Trichodesmium sp. St15_bin1_1]
MKRILVMQRLYKALVMANVVHQFEKRCNKPGLNDLKIAVVARAKNN